MNNFAPFSRKTNKQNLPRSYGWGKKCPCHKVCLLTHYLELKLHPGGALCSRVDMLISQGTVITQFEWLVPHPYCSGSSYKIFLPYKTLLGHEFVVLDSQDRSNHVVHLFPTFLYKYIQLIVYSDLATFRQCLNGGIRWPGSGMNIQETLRPSHLSDFTCPQWPWAQPGPCGLLQAWQRGRILQDCGSHMTNCPEKITRNSFFTYTLTS